MSERFKPSRAGIIGIWDYAEQSFRFEDGHLVLRGPNGSGKTKALEVLVPFVLDGSIDARRLDPFSGQERTMRSNLLYGGEKARRGYCWLEFARGEERVTIGVGLRAQTQRPDVKRWFFVADGAVGEEIHLLAADRTPTTYRELVAQLGEAHVFTERNRHRAAVDRRLYGLGEERFAAMLDLVLTLRRPQLAKDLDPDKLSGVLSEGLRTVDRDLLRTSATAFDNLEAAQRELSELERAERAVSDLVVHWRTYLRARARRRVEDVRDKQARLHATTRKIAELEIAIQRSAREESAARSEAEQARTRVAEHAAALDALRSREAYKNRGQLRDAQDNVKTAADALASAEDFLTTTRKWRKKAEEALGRAQGDRDRAEGTRAEAWSALRTHLRTTGIELDSAEDVESARARVVALRASVLEVRDLLQVHERRAEDLLGRERDLQEAEALLEQAALELAQAESALEQILAQVEAALTDWHAARQPWMVNSLSVRDLLDRLPGFGVDEDLGRAVEQAWRPLRDGLLRERSEAEQRGRRCVQDMREIQAQIEAIRQERDDAPGPPETRTSAREGRAGGPLWRLVRFREHIREEDGARLEGALLASGVLDAWVHPDGAADLDALDDTRLEPGARREGPTLADLLEVEAESSVDAARVHALLASISLDQGETSVSDRGTFRLGPLMGAHRPARARYIGATARARHRAERIDALETQRRALELAHDEAVAVAEHLSARLHALDQAIVGLPNPAAARSARKKLHHAESTQRATETARSRAARRRADAQRAAEEARRALHLGARDHGTPATRPELEALDQALVQSTKALEAHERATAELKRSEERLATARGTLDARQEEAHQATAKHQLAARNHLEKTQRLKVLTEGLGAEVREILADIKVTQAREAEAQRDLQQATSGEQQAATTKANFIGERRGLERGLPELRDDLEREQQRLLPFQRAAASALLQIRESDAPFEDRLFEAVSSASFTPEQLKTTETRLGKRLATLDDELGTRFHSVRTSEDDIVMVSIADELGEHGVALFESRLADRVTASRRLLEDHEQRLFEDHLLGTLCGQLRERMQETRDLVTSMDEAMRGRQLASGKSIGISWKAHADTDATRQQLLELLGFDARFLTSDRLAKLRRLLSTEVQSARRERHDRSYLEILEGALDYRRWHHFELTLYDASGKATRLTRRAHSRLSGGEKAAAVHLPLFAAAHAHFTAGDPHCPRLVALDEAFAGIDDTGVPQLLRLAAEFDLDWFLTGHDLWVTESFLPGVMHYDLAHDPVSRTVSAWPILWNGVETLEGDAVSG